MSAEAAQLLKLIAYLSVLLGLVGVFVPLLPGTPLIFAGALLWAWADGFQHMGWLTLTALLGLTVIAEGAKFLVTTYGARVAGASWQGVVAATVGALVGLIFFNLPGALLGAVGALLIVDWRKHEGNWREASRLTLGVLLGYVASYAVQFALALVMVAIFVVAVVRG